MPPEVLPVLSQVGPFTALLILIAWLIPKAIASHERIAAGFAHEMKRQRLAMKRIIDRLDTLGSQVDRLEQTVSQCPAHQPPPK